MTFFNNFLEQLCLSENLTDISATCDAKQSSLSKWSRAEDAKQVLFDNEYDFANHTSPELTPWLTIDIGKQCSPEFVIVQNRAKKPFDEIASGLVVEYSKDDIEYSVLHTGLLHFGHFPKSLPLILPLKSRITFRFLRLSITSQTKLPLHLKRVNILISNKPDLTQNQNNVVFYSSRTDGLGERLKSLLNAMVLAEFYNSEFKFTWSNPPNLGENHAINEASTTFSDEFLAKHLIDLIPSNLHDLDKKPNFFNHKLGKKQAIKVSQNSIYKQNPALKNYIERSEYEVNDAINLANQIDIPENTVSIHLRAGDIVYGRYRHGDRYTNKVISYAQADYMITTMQNIGVKVLLFGQKAEVCRYFAEKFGSLFFGDREDVARLSSIQLAIFDMVLMSRTKQIFSGNSGFSQLSELIGNTKIVSPEDHFNVSEMSNHIANLLSSDETRHFDNYQNAFSCWHFVFRYKDTVGLEKSILMLEKACQYDTVNVFYLLVLATLHHEKGNIENSESIIRKILERKSEQLEKHGNYNHLMNYKHPDGTGTMQKYKQGFVRMDQANLIGADELVKDFT
jgi:hypothetical protein